MISCIHKHQSTALYQIWKVFQAYILAKNCQYTFFSEHDRKNVHNILKNEKASVLFTFSKRSNLFTINRHFQQKKRHRLRMSKIKHFFVSTVNSRHTLRADLFSSILPEWIEHTEQPPPIHCSAGLCIWKGGFLLKIYIEKWTRVQTRNWDKIKRLV